MTRKPVILAVDDEPAVAAAIGRDLRRRYGERYWVIGAGGGAEAIEVVRELVDKREVIALVIADQRMPKVTGIDVLTEVGRLAPQARTVLLTAYADTQVAIDAINKVGLDHYLQKPWDPPDDRLYPVLDDLLRDWRASTYLPWDGLQVLGAAWSARTHELQSFLSRQRIPYHYADVESDPRATEILSGLPAGARLPVVIYGDGTTAIDPDLKTVANKVGLKTELVVRHYDVVIVGAGPAGLAASVFCAAEGLHCVVIEKGEIGSRRPAPGSRTTSGSRRASPAPTSPGARAIRRPGWAPRSCRCTTPCRSGSRIRTGSSSSATAARSPRARSCSPPARRSGGSPPSAPIATTAPACTTRSAPARRGCTRART